MASETGPLVGGRVFVIEPSSSGHRLYYVRVLGLSSARPFVWVTTRDALRSEEAALHLGDLIESGQVVPRTLDVWASRRKVIATVIRLVGADGRGDDIVVLPDGDLWLPALAVSLRRKARVAHWSVLVLRPPERWRAARWRSAVLDLPKVAAIRVLKLVSGAFGNDVIIAGLADAFGFAPSNAFGLVSVRDPILPRATWTTDEARADLGLPDDAFVVSMLGAIGPRKNLPLTAAAVSALSRTSSPCCSFAGGSLPI